MAAEVIAKVVDTVRNINTQNLIFQTDKPSQMEEVAGGQSGGTQQTQGQPGHQDTPPGINPPIKPKDFYWDQLVVILVSAILGLTFLDIAVEFFRGSGVQCYTPTTTVAGNTSEEFTRDQASFVNNYCYQSLPSSEYFPLFILAQGLAIIAPHFLWSSLFGQHFDFFFDLAKDLKRLRDIKTGDYNPNNFEIVKKLEKEYKKHTIFYLYIFKLVLQLVFAAFSFFFATAYFDDFSPTFDCPRNNIPSNWPLSSKITCIYTSLRFLEIIRYLDILLVVLVILAVIIGLVWCFLRHTAELGYKDIAYFVVNSCLLAENYVPKNFWIYPFTPRIRNDLDFLLMRLFRTDAGHGQVFKEIQVLKQVDLLTKQDHELLQLFLSAEIEMDKSGKF